MHHVLCDRNGLPLRVLATGANAHDSTMLAPLLDTNPGVREHGNRPGPAAPSSGQAAHRQGLRLSAVSPLVGAENLVRSCDVQILVFEAAESISSQRPKAASERGGVRPTGGC
jgi:hypothetical protein